MAKQAALSNWLDFSKLYKKKELDEWAVRQSTNSLEFFLVNTYLVKNERGIEPSLISQPQRLRVIILYEFKLFKKI